MKNLKIGLIALCGLLLVFSACKKNDSTPTASNSFVVNGKNYTTDNAMAIKYNVGTANSETELLFSKAVTVQNANDDNRVYFDFYIAPLPVGTFTYKDKNDPTFKSSENFADVQVEFGYNQSTGKSLGSFDIGSYDATGSTVTIAKNGDSYTVTYTLKFTDGNKNTTTVTGQYSGTIN